MKAPAATTPSTSRTPRATACSSSATWTRSAGTAGAARASNGAASRSRTRVRYPRILAEDEGLDGHRHRMGRHADAAEIDEVEVAQRDAVDHQDLRADAQLFLEDRAEGLRDVAVEHDVDRLSTFDGVSQAKRDRASKG